MSLPAQQFATRYLLQLSESWQAWFDTDCRQLTLPGSFRTPLAVDRLLADAPLDIWPGFMLPDTLPVVGNEYGDWICARVEADGSLGELLHWYHGGGDWIPLGRHLAEMVVHDVVDQFRPLVRQMLRRAPESIQIRQHDRILTDFDQPQLQNWLAARLPTGSPSPLAPESIGEGVSLAEPTRERLYQLARLLAQGAYGPALECLRKWHWAVDAAACDQIQCTLQQPLDQLADSSIAQKLAMNWTPDYVRWLFDIDAVPHDRRAQMLALAGNGEAEWPQQNWQLAEEVASEVVGRRNNLGWAINIAGWSRQRQGDFQGAVGIYFAGRYASAFSDQAVRMRTHWNDSRYGKFALTQLFALREFLPPEHRQDAYLTFVDQAPLQSASTLVQQFWMSEANRYLAIDSPVEAYESFYRAGWDIGVQRLSEYKPILEGLVHSAQAAGWDARATVAQTHLACLKKRLR